MNKGGISFGFKAVVAGQKTSVINADPQLIAASTNGKFTITPAVSAAMGLQPGDYIQFADNISEIENAIRNKQPELIAVAEENGVDINTPEGAAAIIDAFRVVGIAKGIALLNADGTPKMANARTSKDEKMAYLNECRDEILAAAAEKGIEDPTDEQLLDMIGSKQEPAFSGSKLATTSSMTGYGLGLNFTDSNVWNMLKADLEPEARETTKRIFNVNIKETQTMPVNNGKEVVNVEVFILTLKGDETVAPRGNKK